MHAISPLPFLLLLLAACAPSPSADGDTSTGPAGDPNAPGADCVDAAAPFDPGAVYIFGLVHGFYESTTRTVFEAADPSNVCAFQRLEYAGLDVNVGVWPEGSSMMLGIDAYAGLHGVGRLNPDPFVDRSGAWYPAEDHRAEEGLYQNFAVPDCRLQRDEEGGPVAAFFPALNDVGYRCFEGSDTPGLRRFDDGVPLARFSGELLTFFPDNRALLQRPTGLWVEDVTDASLAEEVQVTVADTIAGRPRSARILDGRVVVAFVDDEGMAPSLVNVDGGIARIEARFQAFDATPEDVAIDRDGRLVVLASRNRGSDGETVLLLRLGEDANDVIYDGPVYDDSDLVPAFSEPGRMYIERLVKPL